MDLDTIITTLDTDPKNGLTQQEAEQRLRDYGENMIPEVKGNFWQIYLAPLFNYLITVYLIMSFVLLILAFQEPSIWPQVALWLSIVIANFIIAIIQQRRAQKKFEALKRLTEPTSVIIRDGVSREAPAEQLVPGDVIELDPGDWIPADARILTCGGFTVDEASLTGESVPVGKTTTPQLDSDTPLSDRTNMVYRGTFVQTGTAKTLVIRTGSQTELGQLSTELAQLQTGEIPLTKKVNVLGKWLTFAIVIFLAVQLIVKGWLLSQGGFKLFERSFIIREIANSIVASMSVMPINIPLLTTITLLTGVLAMATHKVLIRDLSAIESLGRISVLCADKTGTITRNQMTVKRVWDGNQLYSVTGLGYGPSGIIYPVESQATAKTPEKHVPAMLGPPLPGSSLERLLIAGFLNNDAELVVEEFFEPTGEITWRAIGDPTEAALLALFNKSGLDKAVVEAEYQLAQEYAFDSELKRMTKVFRCQGNPRLIAYSKGATEVILERCTTVMGQSNKQIQKLSPEKKAEIQTFADEFAALGFRILSLAYKSLPDTPMPDEKQRSTIEKDMTYLGFVCLVDPPRSGIRESVRECASAGIDTIMITGDHALTAETIAREVNILKEGQSVHEGVEVASLDKEEFIKTAVYARVIPQHKQTIVERYQDMDRVVAMTGDGVNDALAVSMADAGIAMGITGTDVTKEAADLIITDDSFNSIVTGIREGRSLFLKIRMMIWFYLCVNLAEFLVYFGASLIPNFVLITSWQRVYIFSLIHSFPAFGLIWDRIGREIMQRKPLDTEGIMNRKLAKAMLLGAFVLAGVISLVYYMTFNGIIPLNADNTIKGGFVPLAFQFRFLPYTDPISPLGWFQAKARTMFLTTVFLSEAILVLSIRRMDKSFFASLKSASWFVYLTVFFWPIMHGVVMYKPQTQYLLIKYIWINLEIIRLSYSDWMICVGMSLIPILVLELYKWHIRRKGEVF
ncbi:MAG: cation-translocating P-type ATPase [Candidatus Heimdallarchaeota archaeon]